MARAWQRQGAGMARAWQRQGAGMATAWQREGAGMATARQRRAPMESTYGKHLHGRGERGMATGGGGGRAYSFFSGAPARATPHVTRANPRTSHVRPPHPWRRPRARAHGLEHALTASRSLGASCSAASRRHGLTSASLRLGLYLRETSSAWPAGWPSRSARPPPSSTAVSRRGATGGWSPERPPAGPGAAASRQAVSCASR